MVRIWEMPDAEWGFGIGHLGDFVCIFLYYL